jgi:hypothetical protein
MASYTLGCLATYSSISRQQHRTIHLLSILVILLSSFVGRAQERSEFVYVPIERPEALQPVLNATKLTNAYKVIHFGDSHIQGDRISGEVRNNLQALCGNGGSGMFFPYSLCKSVGPTGTNSNITGTYTYSTVLKNPTKRRIGSLGYEITLTQGATFTMEFNEQFRGKRSKEFSILIHGKMDTIAIELAIPGVLKSHESIGDQRTLYTFECPEIPSKIQFRVLKECSLWGLEFIQESGLVYQQCGVVGAQFTHLLPYKEDIISMLKWQKPNLVMFSYGTNESYSALDSIAYEKQITSFILLLKEKLPEVGIIITNAPDTRSAGKTPKSELTVNRCLQGISKKTETAYYDVNRVMGGWGSHAKWQANDLFLKDQLHFNKKGATLMGQMFCHALLKACDIGLTQQSLLEQQITIAYPKQLTMPATTPSIATETVSRTYIVKEGDSLSAIAKKLGTSVESLCKLNGITNPDSLKLGQKISY